VTGASLPGGVLILARNVIGITGIGLLASQVMAACSPGSRQLPTWASPSKH
jgi:hypothetical protein